MPDQWYCSRDGNRIGPVSSQQMCEAVASGKLLPTDMVWKDGMTEWLPANRIKGLFQQARSNATQPPPLPVVIVGRTDDQVPLAQTSTAVTAVALWNPMPAAALSFLFGWAFGSEILSRNWKALGDNARAKRCTIWFYSWIVYFVVAILFLYDPKGDNTVPAVLWNVIVIVWLLVEVKSQANYIKKNLGDNYTRKSWRGAPIGFAAIAAIAVVGMAFLLLFLKQFIPLVIDINRHGR